tara:strand:+ start:46 stop:201 length:156 start_codon:yes stop_codon:yes gene_type:complete
MDYENDYDLLQDWFETKMWDDMIEDMDQEQIEQEQFEQEQMAEMEWEADNG